MAPTLYTDSGEDVILTFYFIDGQVYSAASYLANSITENQNGSDCTKENFENIPQTNKIAQDSTPRAEESIDFTDYASECHFESEKFLQRLDLENSLPCIDDSIEELFAYAEDNRKLKCDGSLASIGDSTKALCSKTVSISSSCVPDDYRSMGDAPDEYVSAASDEYAPTISSTSNKERSQNVCTTKFGYRSYDCSVADVLVEKCNDKEEDSGKEDSKKKKRFLSRIKKTIDGFVTNVEKSATLPMQRTPSFVYSSTSGIFINELMSLHVRNRSTSLSYLDLGGIKNSPTDRKKEKWWRFWKKP